MSALPSSRRCLGGGDGGDGGGVGDGRGGGGDGGGGDGDGGGGGGGGGGGDIHLLKQPAVCMKPGDRVWGAVVRPHHRWGDAPPRGCVHLSVVPARLLQQHLP